MDSDDLYFLKYALTAFTASRKDLKDKIVSWEAAHLLLLNLILNFLEGLFLTGIGLCLGIAIYDLCTISTVS